MKPILTLLLCAVLLGSARAQTYFYIDEIGVQPSPTSDQDNISIALTGGLSSTGAYVVSASASVAGSVVTISIAAADDGGLTVIVPHTEVVPIGQLDAGDYIIVIDGQNVGDFASGPQHQFTVSGGGSPCDSLELVSVRWHAFSDTALVVHVINGNTIGELFDYPNFILFDASGDTLAKETVNFFGIGGESYHTMRIMDGVEVPVNAFSATLELWTGFTTSLACTWELEVDLCPPTECGSFIPTLGNYGGALVLGTFNWEVTDEEGTVAMGQFQMTEVEQYASSTLCLPPGEYQMLVSPNGPPTGGAPMFFVTNESGSSTQLWPVVWSLPVALPVQFFVPCIDGTNEVRETGISPLRASSNSEGLLLERSDGLAIGPVQLFDAQGRLVYQTNALTHRVSLPLATGGIHLLRTSDTVLKVVAGLE